MIDLHSIDDVVREVAQAMEERGLTMRPMLREHTLVGHWVPGVGEPTSNALWARIQEAQAKVRDLGGDPRLGWNLTPDHHLVGHANAPVADRAPQDAYQFSWTGCLRRTVPEVEQGIYLDAGYCR
ncbi:MAG: hypothetical protein AB7T63_09930 [Planctomycetota bacterium]